ncbi:MAG: PH domain-containing protein [Candidatus Doudnabacteria bacterium]|nr:PH domain-containing protein [Candidatus Doudnabacteria bacterium]
MNYKSGEKVIKFYTQSRVLPVFYFGIFLLSVGIPMYFLKKYELFSNFSRVYYAWLGVSGLLFIRLFALWRMNKAVLTSQRLLVIIQHGIFHREVVDVPKDKVANISYEKIGIFQAIFNFGNMAIRQVGLTEPVEIKNLQSPQVVKEEIMAEVRKEQ